MQRSLTGDEKIREIYGEALKRPTAERMSCIASQTATDPDVRRVVELLLVQNNATALHSEPARRRSVNQDVGPGTIIGAYEVERLLGAGGMGVVLYELLAGRRPFAGATRSSSSSDRSCTARRFRSAISLAALRPGFAMRPLLQRRRP